MPSTTFTVDDFNLSTSWTYTPDYDDDAGTRYDRTKSPSSRQADKTFTITGIDMSTINSIVLTWDVTHSLSGSIKTPSSNYGYRSARVYQGASTSGTYVAASKESLDLTSYVGTNTEVTCRFYYYPSGLPSMYYEGEGSYGAGSCSGTVYFKNVTLTVTYGEERDDPGMGLWLGNTSNLASAMKGMWIGDENGKARKVKAAWIGINGVARLFYQATVKLLATEAFERGGDGITTGDLQAFKSGSGYAVLSFPANTAFANAQKLTLHFYLVSKISTFDTIALRSGTVKNDEYGKSTGIATPVPDFTPSALGWQSVDLTVALDASGGGVARAEIAANGLKLFMRSEGSSTIGGIGGANCPYLTIDSTGSSPVEPDTPTQNVAFVVQDDGSVTVENVSFTQLSDGSVQLDNATFTAQDDGSATIQ